MRKLVLALALLVLPLRLAQATRVAVTGTITDSSGTGINGTFIVQLAVQATDTSTNTLIVPRPITYRLINGVVTGNSTINDTANMQPQGDFYKGFVYDTRGTPLATYFFAVPPGAPLNVGQLIPTTVTTNNVMYVTPLTSFTAGNLPPLFTASVATPNPTPVLSFILTNAAANQVFGNCTVSLAAPAYCAITGAMLPNPSSTTLGGVQSKAAVANQWLNSIGTNGVPTSTQPAFTDVSGTLPVNRLVAGSNGQCLTTASGTPTWAPCVVGVSQIETASVSGCTTDAPPASVCSNTITWPVAFADASYFAVCSGLSSYTSPATGGAFGVAGVADVRTYTASTIIVVTTNLNEGNIAAAFTTIKCIGVHP